MQTVAALDGPSVSDSDSSMIYDLAIVKLHAEFEAYCLEMLKHFLNRDPTIYARNNGYDLPEHLPAGIAELIITNGSWWDFRGKSSLVKSLKEYGEYRDKTNVTPDAPVSSSVIAIVKKSKYDEALDILPKLRNLAAHGSTHAYRTLNKYLSERGRTRSVARAGAYLKAYGRFSQIAGKLVDLASEIEAEAEF